MSKLQMGGVLTAEYLRKAGACADGLRHFEQVFPDGIPLTSEGIVRALYGGLGCFFGWAIEEADVPREILNLSRANLRGANLRGADLIGANLRGANLSNADLRGAYLSNANLSRANLRGANLRGANLSGTDLRGTDLSNANLSRANLSNANLSRANLRGADLSGTDLRWAYGIPIGVDLSADWVLEDGVYMPVKKEVSL